MLIVNADDFGFSSSVNRAVMEAFERRLISSATVMPNMTGFDEACALTLTRGVEQHVGAHLVLTAGSPLSERIRRCRRFCDEEGRFHQHRAHGRVLRLSADERRPLVEELHAQIDACRQRGLPVTHLDSHQHVHTEPALGSVVIAVAHELGVPHVRLARNCQPSVALPTRFYRSIFNSRLRRAGLAATRYFGDIDDYIACRSAGVPADSLRDLELMTHPQLDEDGSLVDYHCAQSGAPLDRLLADVDGIGEAVSYAGARL